MNTSTAFAAVVVIDKAYLAHGVHTDDHDAILHDQRLPHWPDQVWEKVQVQDQEQVGHQGRFGRQPHHRQRSSM